MTDTLTLTVNGEPRRLRPGATVSDLLHDLGPAYAGGAGIAVARNERVVRRADWPATRLEAGDAVEVITAKQGG